MKEYFSIEGNVTPSDWMPDKSIIKVIGVGGGGCNAVTYMYNQRIEGCTFIVCNTDNQSLQDSNVPVKIQLGKGLGAGTDPIEGRNAALEAQDTILEKVINNGTRMLFITAGMGGGTGTGASPVIAKLARDAGILTVAVVTLPFKNESRSQAKAIDGIRELEKNVDSLLLINNEKLYEFYGNELLQDAFPRTDEVLATAVRGITEIIGKRGYVNVDFKDVRNMMKDSGMALMGTGTGNGEHRLADAVKGAFESPLLNDFELKTAKNILINITCGNNEHGLKMNDMKTIDDMIAQYTGNANTFKKGLIYDDDPDFGDTVKITAIATGFDMSRLGEITDVSQGNLIVIGSDFTYSRSVSAGAEVDLPNNTLYVDKIGFNSSENHRSFDYDPAGEKPVLCVAPGDNLTELESTPAIRRAHIDKK